MKIKIGTIDCNTGLVFAGYGKTYKNGEWWITKEKYDSRKNKEALNARNRYHQSEENKNKVLARSKAWREGIGKEWVKSYESSEARLEKARESNKYKYKHSEDFRENKLKKSRRWSSSPAGRQWDSNRKKKSEELEKRRKRQKLKLDSNPVLKAASRVRNKTCKILKTMRMSRSLSASKMLGIDIARFKSFIESQFTNGMNWDNIGKWHIDHFIPMATAKTTKDINRLSHYSNLRPMWAIDNLKKSDKIPSISDVVDRNNFLDKWLAQMGGVQTQQMQQG
jgi:hypothetical protein